MSSLMSSISTALSGLQTTSTLIQLVSENISSAGTTGYTTKSAVLSSSVNGGSTVVTVSGYTRATDDATRRALLSATTEDGSLGTTDSYMTQVESLLGSTDSSTVDSLADYISAFASAWSALDASPESETAQSAVISAGEDLANAIQSTANSVEDLARTVTSNISTTVSTLNSDLKQIANYNKLIAAASASGSSTGDLEDSRDQLIQDVASITGITVSAQSNGTVSVYTTGGYELVSGTVAKTFAYESGSIVCSASPSVSLNTTLTGGALESELNFIDTSTEAQASSEDGVGTIAKLRSMLDSVVDAFTSTTSSFTTAYNNTSPADITQNFFYVGETAGVADAMDRTNIAVNAGLVSGSLSLITTSAEAVSDVFNISTLSVTTTSGQTFSNCSYETLATSIISYYQNSANSVSSLADTASTQKTTLQTTYANNTGVSTDTELVKLTTLENSYNASAKVISVIQEMMDTLTNTF